LVSKKPFVSPLRANDGKSPFQRRLNVQGIDFGVINEFLKVKVKAHALLSEESPGQRGRGIYH
jgi:hypothetical protein